MATNSRRIGLLVDSLIGGGAERIALNFARGLQKMGHEAHIIMLRNEIEHDASGVNVHALTDSGSLVSFRPLNKLLLAWRLRSLTQRIESDGKRFDFFISNAEDMDRISRLAKIGLVFIRYRNAMLPVIRSKIGATTGIKRKIRTFRWFRKFRRIYSGQNIVAVSQALEHELVNQIGIKPASITTIYNPFDFDRIRDLSEQSAPIPAGPYIVYAARISGRKAQHVLLQAYAQLDIPQKLVLLGGTTSDVEREYKDYLLQEIERLGISERVIMPGFHQNPYPWIKHADLFAMSSRGEGLPLVLVESLILGTPVVSTNCPTGPDEVLLGELSQFLSPVDDVNALAHNIKKALASYPELNDAQLDRFRDEYAINRYLEHSASLHH